MKKLKIRELVHAHLDKTGGSLQSFARIVGVSDAGLRLILTGGVERPRSPTIFGLAKALGMKPEAVRALFR